MRCFRQILSTVVLILTAVLNLCAQSPAEAFNKSYQDFKSIKSLVFNATLKTFGKRAGKTVDVDGRFGLMKNGLELRKFRHVSTLDVTFVNMIFFEEVVYNGDTFYSYNFEKRRYENKGKLYAEYQGKRKTRTVIFIYSDLVELYQEFEDKKNSIVYSADSIGYNLRIPVNRDKGQAIMYFKEGSVLPYQVIEYDRPGNANDYATLTLANVRLNLNFPENYFDVPSTNGAVEYKNTTETMTMPMPVDAKNADLLAINTTAPVWEVTGQDGVTIKSSEYRGKVVIMDFWATWCVPCAKAMPALQRIHETYKDVVVLGFNEEETAVDLDEYKARKKLGYTLLPSSRKIGSDYKVNSLPTIYIVDKHGKIIYASVGYIEGEDDTLISMIEMALK
ncbi:hypothetical protein WSM22_38740 [Cytophagales bacterium WSM2-2]|nr:hypothetical protein WSM22_38740 [Cytophagales bacterium WSM2-2]